MEKDGHKNSDVFWLSGLIIGLVWSFIVPFLAPYFLAKHTVLVEALGGTTLSMVTAGGLVRTHRVSLLLALTAPLVAFIRSSPFYWWAGRRYGHYLMDIFSSKSPHAQKMARRAEVTFHKLGPWAVVFAYFLPVPNGLIFAVAGWAGMRLSVFVLLGLADALLYSTVMVVLGYFLGQEAITTARLVTEYAFVAVILTAILLVISILIRQRSSGTTPSSKEMFLGADSKVPSDASVFLGVGKRRFKRAAEAYIDMLNPEAIRADLDSKVIRPKDSSIAVGVADSNGDVLFITIDSIFGNDSAESLTRPYHLGTFSSVLTSSYLGSAVAAGEASLNDSWVKASTADVEEISFERLATHTSGLPYLPWNFLYKTLSEGDSPLCRYSEEDIFRFSTRRRRASVGYRYSNVGVSLVGLSLGGGSVKGFQDGIISAVLTPLKMTQTNFCTTDSDPKVEGFRNQHRVTIDPAGPFTPAMGLVSTPVDLMSFLRYSLHPETSALKDGLKLCQRTHSVSRDSTFAMGLGWHVFLGRQGTWLYHEIRSEGSSGVMALHPQQGWGMFAISNCGDASTQVSLDTWARSILAQCVHSD